MASWHCPNCRRALVGTETTCPQCGQALTPAFGVPAAGAHIEVRQYDSVGAYQVDAAVMAAAGWVPHTQSESSGGANGVLVAVGIATCIIGLIAFWPLLVLSILAFIAAYAGRSKGLVVTYRPAGGAS
jgi:hypothetical protein